MVAMGIVAWLAALCIVVLILVALAVMGGLFAKPAAPKVPRHVIAGTTIRIEDGGSPKLMLLLHPLQFQVWVLENAMWRKYAESKETKKQGWHWTVPRELANKVLRFTATNECPVSSWDTKPGRWTERIVEDA